MSWRYQPPVVSPVTPGMLGAGILAAVGRTPRGSEVLAAELKTRYQASDLLLTDSGTSALVIVLRALLPSGGTIAYPSYACVDITAAALKAGVRVRLYDLDPMTLSPDLDSVRSVMERGVDAILVAHLYGYPADVPGVNELAKARGTVLIEDAAQAAGGTLRGRRLGALADISILSFGRGKGTTAGSGGAVIVRNSAYAESIRVVARQLADRSRGMKDVLALTAQWALARPKFYRLPAFIPGLHLGDMIFQPATEPSAISAAAAAMLLKSVRGEDRELSHRRARAGDLMDVLAQTRGRAVPIRPIAGGESGFLRFAFVDGDGDLAPRQSLGVVRGYPLTLDQHVQLRPLLEPGELAGNGACRLRDRLFTAPTHSRVSVADVGRIRRSLAPSRSRPNVEAFAT